MLHDVKRNLPGPGTAFPYNKIMAFKSVVTK